MGKPAGRLVAIIDDYKDKHGQPADASIARAIDVAPQTISSWRKRGIKELPDPVTLRRLAGFVGLPPRAVIHAAMVDAGYMTAEEAGPVPSVPGPTAERRQA